MRIDLEQGTARHPGGRDTIAAVEDITGTPFVDVLLGSSEDNVIHAWGSDDRIDGRAGDDRLFGQGGTDEVDGGDDDDICHAETMRNCERVLHPDEDEQ